MPIATPHGVAAPVEHKPGPTPEVTKVSVPLSEMKKVPGTPEMKKKKVDLGEGFNTAVSTMVEQFTLIDKMPVAARPANTTLPGLFYETVKMKYPGTNADNIQEMAEKFLKENGGAGIRMAMKLAELEAATLQAFSGREFKKGKTKTAWEVRMKTKLKQGAKGITKEKIPVRKIKRLPGGRTKVEIETEYELVGGETGVITPSLLDNYQQALLNHYDLGAGPLTEEQMEAIDDRLLSVAAFKKEIYQKTGLKKTDLELNYIKNTGAGRDYLTTKISHLIGEGRPGTDVRDILQAEGVAITSEVKKKVQDEIAEKKKKARETKQDERTSARLREQIKKIKENSKLSEAEKQIRIREIDDQLKRLQGQLELFSRDRLLPGEKTDAQALRDAAERILKDREALIPRPAGETNPVDLIKWSGDSTQPESCISLKARLDNLEAEWNRYTQMLGDLREQLKDHNAGRPPTELKKITQVDPSTGISTTIEPDPQDVLEKKNWQITKDKLEADLNELRKKMRVDSWLGGASLADQITEIRAVYQRRKAVIDDAENRRIIDEYHNADKAYKEKIAEHANVLTEKGKLGGKTEAQIKLEIKKLEEEKTKVGEPGGADRVETQSLEALVPVFDAQSTVKTEREDRLTTAEHAALGLDVYDMDYGPQWKDFPDAVKRVAQLVWGDDVLEANPSNKSLAEQVMVLMKSEKYLTIIAKTLESAPGIGIAGGPNVATLTAAKTDGSFNNIADVFNLPAGLKSVSIDKVDKKIIDKIIAEMRNAALNVTTVQTP